MLTELPPTSPKSAPTGPHAQSPGHRPPADSTSLLRASGEGRPASGVRTWQCLRSPYHLVFILFLRLCFGLWNFQSCPFKQFILFIPRETERKKSRKSSHRKCSCARPQCPQAPGENPTAGVTALGLLPPWPPHALDSLHNLQAEGSFKINKSDQVTLLLKSL